MIKRKIIKIHEELCNGCGICADACHESAIVMQDGKAKLLHDKYCDGLGDCLPACPTGAIEMIERDAHEYSQEAVDELVASKTEKKHHHHGGGGCMCPGTMAKKIEKNEEIKEEVKEVENKDVKSELTQWPVQLNLVNPSADYFDNANVLIAADCTAFSYGNFHRDFIKGNVTLIGCPKLDDNNYYEEKLTEIFKRNNIKSITVVRMEVPCCSGIVGSVRSAMLKSETIVPYKEVTLSINGEIL